MCNQFIFRSPVYKTEKSKLSLLKVGEGLRANTLDFPLVLLTPQNHQRTSG